LNIRKIRGKMGKKLFAENALAISSFLCSKLIR
jgi:hypothetical protein